VTVANNSRMCRHVPLWFYTQFGADGPAAPVAMLNGESLDAVQNLTWQCNCKSSSI
jgi:hypothetical protein